MFQVLLLLFSIFLLFNVKGQNDNLQKSFTGTCENTDVCLYSLKILTNSTNYNVIISVDSQQQIEKSFAAMKSDEPLILNFPVTQGSIVRLYLNVLNPGGGYIYFEVYNQADGKGLMIQDSRTLSFFVPNNCQELAGCSYRFARSTPWPANVFAKFKVNDQFVATLDDSTKNAQINFNETDILAIEIVGDPLDITDDLSAFVYDKQDIVTTWYANSYYTPMIFLGICAPPIPSPFGGPLILMNQEEIDAFMASIGTTYSTLWYRETEEYI